MASPKCPEYSMPITLGEKVVDFSFDAFNPQTGRFEVHSINEYLFKGKWVVLFFYPGDFTFVCPTELADLAEQHKKFEELGVELITVSTDSKFAHLTWHKNEKMLENMRFIMASDNSGCISRYFGVYDREMGMAHRGTFIINPDFQLVAQEVILDSVGRNAEELVRKLEALAHTRKNPAEVCPAKWSKGQQTIKPAEEHVGDIFNLFMRGR